jgi:hypothetical protein
MSKNKFNKLINLENNLIQQKIVDLNKIIQIKKNINIKKITLSIKNILFLRSICNFMQNALAYEKSQNKEDIKLTISLIIDQTAISNTFFLNLTNYEFLINTLKMFLLDSKLKQNNIIKNIELLNLIKKINYEEYTIFNKDLYNNKIILFCYNLKSTLVKNIKKAYYYLQNIWLSRRIHKIEILLNEIKNRQVVIIQE